MITLEKAHDLIQKYLKITKEQYKINSFNFETKSFSLCGNGFRVGFSEKWVTEFRITQEPFKNLYYGDSYQIKVFNEESFIYILKSMRLYLDKFKTFIYKSVNSIP